MRIGYLWGSSHWRRSLAPTSLCDVDGASETAFRLFHDATRTTSKKGVAFSGEPVRAVEPNSIARF